MADDRGCTYTPAEPRPGPTPGWGSGYDEAWAERTVAALREHGVAVDDGLTAAELDAADAVFGVPLPPELRLLLATGVPVGPSPGWAPWADGAEAVAERGRRHLEDIVRWDVLHAGWWPAALGDRPDDDGAAEARAVAVVLAAPPLVPLHGHRFLTTMAVGPRPVLSVWAPHDTIRYGDDLATYLSRELAIPAPPWVPPAGVPVPVWEDLFEDI